MTMSHTIITTTVIAAIAAGALFIITPHADARGNEDAQRGERMEKRTASSSASTTAVARTCIALAVKDREGALLTGWNEYSTSMQAGLTKRSTALIAAWNLEDTANRRTALLDSWKTWRADRKAAHTELRKDRKAAWDAFRKTAKDTCRTTVPKEEGLEKAEKDGVSL